MQKRALSVLVISLLFVGIFLTGHVSAAPVDNTVVEFIQTPVISQFVGIVFGIWDADAVQRTFTTRGGKSLVNESNPVTSSVIIYILVWLIVLFVFADILLLVGPFSSSMTAWVVGAALTIIAAQVKFVFAVSGWLAAILVFLGVASAFIAILMTFVAFIALSFGSLSLRKWVVRRQIAIAKVRALEGRENAIEGLKTLKDLGVNVKKRS